MPEVPDEIHIESRRGNRDPYAINNTVYSQDYGTVDESDPEYRYYTETQSSNDDAIYSDSDPDPPQEHEHQ
jgi:hypothetical protein